MRISDWSSDVCSSDLDGSAGRRPQRRAPDAAEWLSRARLGDAGRADRVGDPEAEEGFLPSLVPGASTDRREGPDGGHPGGIRARDLDEGRRRRRKAMGEYGVSKSQVSRLCEEIDEGER